MGVVRIDDKLLSEIKKVLKEEDNKYRYGSIASFINSVIHESLKEREKNGTQ